MRVLFISDFFHPSIGGIEVRSLPFLQSMRGRGHEIVVLTNRDGYVGAPAESDYDGLRVLRLPFAAAIHRRDLSGIVKIKREIRALKEAFKPEIVHAFVSGPLVMAHIETDTIEPSPFLISFTQWLEGSTGSGTLLGRMFGAADWVTANSARLLSQVREIAPDVTSRSSAVHSGNIWPDFEPAPFQFDRPNLLCIGRLIEEKGFDIALRAMPAILARFPSARLIIAGDGPNGPMLRALTAELGLSDQVTFLGWVEPGKVLHLMNEAAIVVVPSRWQEAFASVAIQAAQVGRPAIATDRGGMAEAVLDGETGLIVPSDDVEALADSVIRLLGDPPLAMELGRRARVRARTLFSWDRYLDDFEELYARLAANWHHRESAVSA